MFFGAGSVTVSPSSKNSISYQWIKSLDHLKSLSKSTFAFSDPTQAYLSLARLSNTLSLKISLRGFQHKCFCTIGQSSYHEVSIFTSTINQYIFNTGYKLEGVNSIEKKNFLGTLQPLTRTTFNTVRSQMCLHCIDLRCLAGFQFFFGWLHLASFGDTSSQSAFSFRLNTNSAISIWPAVLHSSAIARSSV